jgi:hypothetical protein
MKKILLAAYKWQSALSAKYPGGDLFSSSTNQAQIVATLWCHCAIFIWQSTGQSYETLQQN